MIVIISLTIPIVCIIVSVFTICDALSIKSDKAIALNKSYRSMIVANLKARGAVLHPKRYAEGHEVYCWPENINVNAINARSEDLYIITYANGR